MTGRSRESEREAGAGARAGRAALAGHARASGPDREKGKERSGPRWKFWFFLFQNCKMILSFVIYVINYL
jgi:hypothetical protein